MPSIMTTRKMRRNRDAASSSENLLSAYELYAQGDSSGALTELRKDNTGTKASYYNEMILQHLQQQNSSTTTARNNSDINNNNHNVDMDDPEEFVSKLQKLEDQCIVSEHPWVSHRKLRRNGLICAYNRALVYFALKDLSRCTDVLLVKLRDLIETKPAAATASQYQQLQSSNSSSSGSSADDLVACRMGLLLLECILCKTVGRHSGLDHAAAELKAPKVSDILAWLESLQKDKDVQLKFLFPVFKSRVAVAQLEDSKHVDSQIRAARKDIKTAMEVFQHKLRPEATESIAAASGESEEDTTMRDNASSQPPSTTIVVQKLNQAALSLKAHLEQLKGNTKKSLILCTEASTPMVHPEYLHSNNLAVVYETNDRRQLALYSLAKSLRASDHELFASDGTAQYDHRLSVLHNVALIALRARRYESAYECFAACLTGPKSVFRDRITTWLRLAEACIGIHSTIMMMMMDAAPKYSAIVGSDGEIQGIMVNSILFFDDAKVVSEELVSRLGSSEDMAQVKRNPLLRARAALQLVLFSRRPPEEEKALDVDTIASARLSLAFVHLAFGDFPEALQTAQEVLAMETTSALPRLHDRHMATARMYAAEACCRLGEYPKAMSHLHGDNKDDPYFYQLASQLSGVTLETASSSRKGKRCLAKTQAIVLSSACAVAAAMGDPTAKQLAHSANSMDSSRTYARRALIYTLLREGNLSSSLNMLLTLR